MKQLYTFLIFLTVFGCIGIAHAQVKGVVFRDFDLNGVRSDTLPIEVGIAGVTVLAFVDLNKTPVQTITDTQGNYSFSAADIPSGMPVRIEFNNLPDGNYNGPYGTGSGTTVQFVKAPAEHVNIGINYPADYCQRTGVRLIVPCYVNGNSQTTTDANGNLVANEKQSAKGDVLVDIAYEASGMASPSNFPPNHMAFGSQIGAVWSLAYQRRNKKIFSAAVVKRHMSFGPLGTGGIYMTDAVTHTTTSFLDVKTLGIDTGNDPHSGLFGDKTQASSDPGAMNAAGRVSFGGMDMSEDDKTIYFINLNDRKVYGVFINSPAEVPTSQTAVKSWSIPNPGCSNGDFRPWALKVYHGKIYVGVVCSAETSQLQSDLKATIYRFDPKAASPVFDEILAFPLDFRRGPADLTGTCIQYDHWLPWTDAWPTPCGQGSNSNFIMYPQPAITDMEFDDDGSMMIGFMDRFGNMVGVANQDPQGNGSYDGFTGGDLLRAYNNNGTLELEKNGKAGNLTGSGVGNNEGPVDANNVGGEFFGKDNWTFFGNVAHAEVTNGALSFVPGYTEIITSAFDPIAQTYQSGGLKVFNSKTGATNRDYVLYTLEAAPGSFGKAAGLGDIKALCDPASVEIGNRVWFDDNRDGIQDAYEPGIDGIVLTLHDMENGGSLIATQTTHDGGQFYFNKSTVPGGLQYDHKYEIRMDTIQLPTLDITLSSVNPLASPAPGGRIAARSAGARQALASPQRYYTLSPANRTGFNDPGLRDSNAQMVGGTAVIALTSLDAGQNDFTYDLSIYSCPVLTAEKDTIALCPGTKIDSIAAVGSYLSRVDSVRFVLFTSPQSGTAMYGSGGVVLSTIKPDGTTNRAVLHNPVINTTSGIANQYIYAIIYPTPENPACRQSDVTVVKLSPSLVAKATGGQLNCSIKSVTLKGSVQYGNGTTAPSAIYAWTGPNSFSSSVQNPSVTESGSYTLTVGDPACPGSFTMTIAEVTSDTVSPTMSTSVVAKTCPTCTAHISAESPGATLSWTGPNGFTAVGAGLDVLVDGTYSVTATTLNGCWVTASVLVTPSFCPALTTTQSSLSLCSGASVDSLVTVGQHLSGSESVRFVLFSSPQSGTAMYGSGGVVLGMVGFDELTKRAVLKTPVLNTSNNGSVISSQYIYALIYPTPVSIECRQSAETVVRILPAIVATATSGTLSCSVKSVQLKGTARYGDGTVVSQANYAWLGPNNFISLEQNPNVTESGSYTLTVGDPACPGSFTTTVTEVTSDTVSPTMSTSVVAKICPTCMAHISAESPGATLSWTGPNGFTAVGAGSDVLVDGTYSVTATASNGCWVTANLQVIPFSCPTPVCVPILINRIR